MNLVYLVCNKCEGVSEKDVPINFNKKNSKNSIINQNIEIPKDELLSNDSTSNLEIIDYPYALNFSESYSQLIGNDLNVKRPSNDFYLNHIQNIQKLPGNKLESNNINSSSIKNSLGESSIIVNNEDNIIQNKALLSNYYANYANIKKRNIIKKYVPKNNSNKIRNEKKNCKKLIIDVGKKYTDNTLKKNNSSTSQIFKLKNKIKEIKVIRTDIRKNKTIKKCNTNFNIQIPKKIKKIEINNKMTETNNNNISKIILNNKSLILKKNNTGLNNKHLILNNKSFVLNNKNNKNIKVNHKKLILNHKNGNLNNNNNNCIDNEKDLNKKITNYNEDNGQNKISQEKNSVHKLKKIYKGANTLKNNIYKNKSSNKIGKKYSFFPKIKFSNSSYKINDSLINKIYVNNYRNSTTNNIENKRNNFDFSYVWLSNRDTTYLSKSYTNPFDKIVNKKYYKKNNKIE